MEGVGSPHRRAGMIGRLSLRARQGWEAQLDGREGSGGPPGALGGVGRPSWWDGRGGESLQECRVRKPFCRARQCWEAAPDGQERLRGPFGSLGGLDALPKGPGEVGSPLRGLGVVVMPSQKSGRVRRPTWREGRSWEALLESREELGWVGEVGRPYRKGLEEL